MVPGLPWLMAQFWPPPRTPLVHQSPTHTPDLLQPRQWGPTACVVQSPAPHAGPCTHVDTHARNTRVQVLTHRYLHPHPSTGYLHPHPSTGLLLGVYRVTFLQSPTRM